MEYFIKWMEDMAIKFEKKMGSASGLTYMVISATCQSLNGLFIKMTPRVGSFQFVYYRNIYQLAINLKIANFYQMELMPNSVRLQRLLVLRGFAGFMGISCYFYSCTTIPLAEAQTLLFTSSVWTGILATLILKEKYSKIEIFSGLLGLIGIILIMKPDFLGFQLNQSQDYSYGRFIALCGSIFQACMFIFIRALRNECSIFVTNIYLCLICVILSPIFMFYQNQVLIDLNEFSNIILMSSVAYIQQNAMTRGMMLEKPSKNAVINYLQIPLSLLYGQFLLNELIDTWSCLGCLIILSTAFILFYKNQYQQQI